MRFPGSVFIVSLLTLGVLCQGIVLLQLSQHPERGHRGPAETLRAAQFAALETDAFHLSAAGFDSADPRAW